MMKQYKAIIVSMDDYHGDRKDLHNEDLSGTNHGVYPFDVPVDFSEEYVTLIAWGIFFDNDWCMDGTMSTVVEVDNANG